ncbi:MAG TPA: nucleoside deaminase [Ignavibacteriaceae bacterium]|nr:nucleoside deaminase [Ignavibacteriaceae bacterium]
MDELFKAAVNEAKKGLSEGGIPIGSVLVKDGKLIARGHNKRVQDNNPMVHAEIDCLINAGRIGSYKDTVLYSTLMPCYLCAGAVVQFGIKKVIAGESKTFPGAVDFMKEHGVEVINLNDQECINMMKDFISSKPELWNEDIGK